MRYGVNLKVETQLVAGDGTAPNISGVLDTGNFTAHGYANAALGSTLKKLVLIRKVLADSWAAGFPADGIVLNPADWATIELELLTTAAGQTLYSVSDGGQPRLFGVPVVQSVGMTADNVAVGAFAQALKQRQHALPLRREPLATAMQAAAQRLSGKIGRRDGRHQRTDGAVLNSNACCEPPPDQPGP